MTRTEWAGPKGLVLASAAASGVLLIEQLSPVRPLLIIAFISVCPGLALVGLLRVEGWTQRVVLSTAVSWSLATVAASISVYAGSWSSSTVFLSLVAVTLLGAALQVRQPSPATGRNDST